MSLYGVYGSHTVEACPVNNLENAKRLVSFAESDPTPLLSKHRINEVLGQYHSAFEHTFLWIVDAEDPHLVEKFAIEPGLASFKQPENRAAQESCRRCHPASQKGAWPVN